jgi:hypothetical protein
MATIGALNKKSVSAVSMLDARDIFPNIIDTKNEDDFSDVLKMMGRYDSVEAKNWEFHNFVTEDINQQLTAGTVTNNASTAVTVVVTPEDTVRLGDLITTIAGNQGIVTSVTRGSGSDTIIISGDTALSITAADILVIGSRAESERSSAPENLKYTPTKYLNKIQIFRETDDVTDVEKTNEVEVVINGQPLLVNFQAIKKLQKLKSGISYQFIAGKMSTDSFSDASPVIANASGYTSQRTRGLYDYIVTYGVNDTVTTPGTVLFADLADLVNKLVANRAPSDYLMWHGTSVGTTLDAYFKGAGSSGLTSAHMNVDGKEVNFEIEKFSVGGVRFQKMRLPFLDNDKLFNFTGNVFNKCAYLIPAGKIKTEGGPAVGRIRVRYVKQAGAGNIGSEIIRETVGGMFSSAGTTQVANSTREWYTAQGLECLGVPHFAKLIVNA